MCGSWEKASSRIDAVCANESAAVSASWETPAESSAGSIEARAFSGPKIIASAGSGACAASRASRAPTREPTADAGAERSVISEGGSERTTWAAAMTSHKIRLPRAA